MGETFWNNVFTINIYGEGGRDKFKSDGRQIQLGELGCLDHLRFKQNTQSRHFFYYKRKK